MKFANSTFSKNRPQSEQIILTKINFWSRFSLLKTPQNLARFCVLIYFSPFQLIFLFLFIFFQKPITLLLLSSLIITCKYPNSINFRALGFLYVVIHILYKHLFFLSDLSFFKPYSLLGYLCFEIICTSFWS